MSVDTAKKAANYVFATWALHTGANANDELDAGELNFSRGHVFKHINISYGVYGFIGSLKTTVSNPDEIPLDKKNFGGFGARASVNAFAVIGRTDFRFIGLEFGYSDEFGEYAAFRKTVMNEPASFSIPRTQLFTAGLSSEVVWHHRKYSSTRYGFRFFIGPTLGNYTYKSNVETPRHVQNTLTYRTGTAIVSTFIQYRQFFGMIEGNGITKGKFSLGYRL
jgi:hypothetical protein